MTDDTSRRAIDGARNFQREADAAGYGRPKEGGLGKAIGVVMVRSLEHAYSNGRADARTEIEKALADLPVRTRQGVELVERGSVLRIVHELDTYSDGTDT